MKPTKNGISPPPDIPQNRNLNTENLDSSGFCGTDSNGELGVILYREVRAVCFTMFWGG